MRSSLCCPLDRQSSVSVQEKWIRRQRDKVSGIQGSLDPVYTRERQRPGEVLQRPSPEIPETALIVQRFVRALAGFAPGAPEK